MKKTDALSELRRCAKQIGAEELLTPEVEAGARVVRYAAGQTVMVAGDEIRQVLILVEGVLQVYSISEKGKLGIVAHAVPPQLLGDIEYMQGLNALHSVQTETDAVLISFPIALVRQHLSHSIAFYRLICNNLIEKLYRTSGAYSRSLLYPAQNRFARYVLERMDDAHTVHLKSSEAAEFLGITPRHMSRIITAMEKGGILCRDRAKTLRVLDPARLSALTDLF
ncbi:MAG: Crp/Fnr family transcriptional regulator [Oscillibacter sp.]|nr:Crp/Fnr family transcriptional regulator [Oscillibacter sp.]